LRIDSQRLQLRMVAGPKVQLEARHEIRRCFYPRRSQHVPSLAPFGSSHAGQKEHGDTLRICNPGRGTAVQASKHASKEVFL
jgi:hypothetical protein